MAHLRPGVVMWQWMVVVAVFTSTMSQVQGESVPSLPASQEESPLANLWRQALRMQSPASERGDVPVVKTFLAPSFGEVVNWVPQDSPHPLYVDQYTPLLREILRDYMLAAEVEPNDTRMTQPDGLQETNLNGKTVTFKKDAAGIITVNGVPARESKVNNDGTVSYILSESLFGHREKVNQAWKEYTKNNPPRFGPLGRPLGGGVVPPPPPSE